MFLSYKVTKNICHSRGFGGIKDRCHEIVIKPPAPVDIIQWESRNNSHILSGLLRLFCNFALG